MLLCFHSLKVFIILIHQSLRDSDNFWATNSYEGGGWKYTNNTAYGHVVTGYENTYHSYDVNLKIFHRRVFSGKGL